MQSGKTAIKASLNYTGVYGSCVDYAYAMILYYVGST